MHWNKNTIYYLLLASIFVLLKLFYTQADNSSLAFLLRPTSYSIELVTGSSSIFISERGFFHEDLNILIDKSCSGFNFWMLCFTLFSFTLIQSRSFKIKFFILPITLCITYILTLFTNTSRILMAIRMQTSLHSLSPNWSHEAQGSFVYVFFFILFYLTLHFIFLKDSYEKPTQP
jgi:exosortase K